MVLPVPLHESRNPLLQRGGRGKAGQRLQRGGVGFYPTSGSPFVHLDTGNVRHWPRMTHEQLARVFPDGKTVHVPSDGRPLARYAQAVAALTVEVAARTSPHSFQVLRRRWVAERTFGWLMRYRRLARDYERTTANAEVMIYWPPSSS